MQASFGENEMKSLLFKWANQIGFYLGFAGLIFVIFKIKNITGLVAFHYWSKRTILGIGILILISCLLNGILVIAWKRLLNYCGSTNTRAEVFNIFGNSYIAKYIPGNVFQFIGRLKIGKDSGIPSEILKKSIFLELVLIATSAILFAPLALIRLFSDTFPLWAFLGFTLLQLAVAMYLFVRHGHDMAIAYLLYIFFMIIGAFVFVAVLCLNRSACFGWVEVLVVVGYFTIAWVGGLLVPGAPAGIGIREALLVYLLKGIVSPQPLLEAIVISRLISFSGDVIFYLASVATHFRNRGATNISIIR